MQKIKVVVSILLSVFLFAGFKFVPFFSSGDTASATFIKNYEIYIYLVIVFAFIGQQIYIRRPKRASLADIRANEDVVKVLLMKICDNYYKYYKTDINNHNTYTIRINIMLPTYNFFGKFQYLKIYYYYGGPEDTIYNPEELKLEWREGVGCSGEAWSEQKITLFDSQESSMQRPGNSLTETHSSVIGHINSVASIPITDVKNEVIGILNIDSTHNMDKTKFHNEDAIYLFKAGAELISPMLCKNGVVKK